MSSRLPADQLIVSMAQKVKFVSFDMVQANSQELTSRWYNYEGIDLYFFQSKEERIVKLHITVFGQVIDWNVFDGVRTGLLLEEDMLSEGPSGVIHYDKMINWSTVAQAHLVLDNAFEIDGQIRQELKKCLQRQQVKARTRLQRVMDRIKSIIYPAKL